MAKVVASCSSRILIHDAGNPKSSNYTTATSGGTGLQPTLTFPSTSHASGSKISSLAWSHNNQIIASGADDGQIVLSLAQTGKKVHTI